jgi:type I restriction enzyme M protein
VEAVILLQENLFYNTSAPGIILVINKAKDHPDEILLVNASEHFEKGRPKNVLTEEHIAELADIYLEWQEVEEVSVIVSEEEVARNDYNLSPSRYVVIDDAEPVLPLEEALVLLRQVEEARAEADAELEGVLAQLGFEEWHGG